MIDNLLIVRDNQYGLSKDAVLLRQALSCFGETKIVASRSRGFWQRCFGKPIARRAFHLERVHGVWLSAADMHILIPNQEHFPLRHIPRLKWIGKVFAKTRHAKEIFSRLGVETVYTGFTSADRFVPAVEKDWTRFFHLAGASVAKGTEIILQLWEKHPEWPELVLVQKQKHAPLRVPKNILLVSGYTGDSALRELQNHCGIHLCPSRAEGWGHYIVEALSCGAVVLTTDAPPMNEHINGDCGILVPYTKAHPHKLGIYYHVDAQALEAEIEALIKRPAAEKAEMGARARERYYAIQAGFDEHLASAMTAHS
jgi:hypothetical protein